MNLDILDYFLYLRDVSHKFVVSSKWVSCLKEKKTKSLKSVYQLSVNDCESLFSTSGNKKDLNLLANYIKENSDKGAFLGLISFYGKRKSKILGSLFNIPINYEYVSGEVTNISFDVQNIIINYELLMSFNDFVSDNYFSNFNKKIDIFKSYFIGMKNNSIDSPDFLLKDLEILNSNLKNIVLDFFSEKEISCIEKDGSYESKVNITDTIYADYNNTFIFAFNIPEEISIWENLNNFCNELEKESKIDSNLIQTLLTKEKVKLDNIFDEKIYDLLPIVTSDRQKIAIRNAFTERVSYIQGPPGTGKSHTITAIAMAALLEGKKTLIVSQKNAALGVVRNKLDEVFKGLLAEGYTPYLYFDKNNKKKLKSFIKVFTQKNKHIEISLIDEINRSLKVKRDRISELFKSRDCNKKIINNELDKQYLFSTLNENFLLDAKKINRKINYENDLKLILTDEVNHNFINELKKICNIFNQNKTINAFYIQILKNMNKSFNNVYKSSVNFIEMLKDGILIEYIEGVLSLSKKLGDINTSQKMLAKHKQMELLKSEETILEEDIGKDIVSHYKEKIKHSILSKLHEGDNFSDFDNFEKMLHFQKSDIIMEKLRNINFNNILNVFPLWLCEIKNIGEVIPNTKELFDLIIIDEASQVNITEIFPILYRGKSVCVVGDNKQLGLESVGVSPVGGNYERQVWESNITKVDYNKGIEQNLVVSKSSFLDLITSSYSNISYERVMLDEHFRSMPQLANYTNNEFYDGELKIMTATPNKSLVSCFQAFKIANGKRTEKGNIEEAKKVIEIIKHLTGIKKSTKVKNSIFIKENSIGVISLLRDQVEMIKEMILTGLGVKVDEEKDYYLVKGFRVKCGTPEELQGDEFDSVIISAVVDASSRNTGHYSNPNRLNVATSRARYFTYFVYTDVLRIKSFQNYLINFGIYEESTLTESELVGWTYNEERIESEFERYIGEYLKDIIVETNRETLKIFNQVPFAKKRIDFVIFNEKNQKYVAIEVDGQFHFKKSSTRVYSEEHNERMDLLIRAGWKVVNTPYYSWYKNGKIDEQSQLVISEKERVKREVLRILDLNNIVEEI